MSVLNIMAAVSYSPLPLATEYEQAELMKIAGVAEKNLHGALGDVYLVDLVSQDLIGLEVCVLKFTTYN